MDLWGHKLLWYLYLVTGGVNASTSMLVLPEPAEQLGGESIFTTRAIQVKDDLLF